MTLLVALVGCKSAPEPEEPAPVPVFVDCVDGYGHGRPVGLPDGRIVIHGGGYPSLGGTAMVSTDDGATFDRIQGLFMEGPWVAGDTLFYRGGTGSPGLVAILPDGSRVGAGPVDQPGRVVDGATEIWAAADRRLAWFEDGWVRYSDDAGATWRTVDGGTYRVLANDGGTFRGSRGLVPGPDGLGSYSIDGGVTWERFTFQPYENPREIELFGESGMLFDGQPFEVSDDHGVTWTSTGIQGWPWQVGPGADEIWIASENEVPGFLHHTEDGGLTWARRTLVAGDAGTLDVSFMGAVVLDSQGRRVFLVVTAAGDGPWSGRDLRCTETPSGGSMRTVRDIADTANTPESVAWWSEPAPVPMPGRGEKAAWTGHWQNAYETTPWVVDYVRDPVWVDRTPEGDLLFLLRPEGGVDGQYGPPMRILRVDGTDANTIVGGYAFENLTNGAGLNAPSLYLEADRFEMLPDGRIFLQTANGSYDIRRQRGSQVPMPGEGRWGLRGGEPVHLQVPPRFPPGSWVEVTQDAYDDPQCLVPEGQTPDVGCVPPYMDGLVQDYAVLEGRVFAIDMLNGTIVTHSSVVPEPDSPWTVAVEGLQQPTDLYVDVETDDRGLYVYDSVGWWRIVPGAGAPIRPTSP